MRTSAIVCSLLLVALFDLTQCQFLTIPAGLATAGLAAAGATALGLGAVGVGAALARGRGGGRRRGGFRRGRRFRGRRSAADFEDQEAVWEEVTIQDPAQCVQKLICLLEAAEGKLDDNEKKMVKFVGDLGKAELEVYSKLPYEAAGWLGKFRGETACEVAFGETCGYGRADMMAFIAGLWKQVELDQTATEKTA